MFDVGALIFKIQTAGLQVFSRDMSQADQAVKKVEGSSKSASTAIAGQGKATDELGKKSSDAAPKQRKQAEATEAQVAAAKGLSLALIAGGAAITALVGLSVAKYAEFDAALSNVRAATMATADEQRILADAALEAGADTAYSASEAAAAQEELAKAGQSVAQIVNGSLNGALALAAAGQLQVARSAEIMATTLTQFKLPAEDAARVSDVLAAGAGKAQGSVDDLSLALSYVGPLAQQAGWSLEETGGTLAYFASQGILGEKAGTSLRGVLASLQSPSMIAKKTMEEYGLSIYDAQGNMLSASEIAGRLQGAFRGLTQEERNAALGRIFGNESLLAATLLYEGGAEQISKWTSAVDDTGYAAEQAAIRQDNLAGDIEKLGGAFDTALIRTGSGANEVLRQQVQILTALVDWYGELPQGVQTTALVVGVLTGAVLLASGAALGLTARFTELRVQLAQANISMTRTAAIGGAVGLALAGVVAVVAILAQRQAEANAGASEFADTLDDLTGAATENTRAMIAKKLADRDAFEGARNAGISQKELTDALYEGGDAVDAVRQKMYDYANANPFDPSIANSVNTLNDLENQLTGAAERHDDLKAASEESATATEESAETAQTAADAYLEAAAGADELSSQLSELIDQINEANGVGQDAITANLDYQNALAEVNDTIQKAREGQEGYTLTLDTTTQSGRDNMAMLVGLADDARQAADAQFALDGNTANYRATLESSRQTLIDRARDLGYNADEAAALADQIFRIPSETEWEVIAQTQAAQQSIEAFIRRNADRRFNIYIDAINTGGGGGRGALQQADGGKVEFFANGGRSEHHFAQFARAGDWRVWAEPETGGEWYLPHSPAKRGRSLAIAQQMLGEWGYAMIPAGARGYSEGTPVQQPASLDGLVITGTVEMVGDGMLRFVDARLEARDRAQAREIRGRTQTR